VKDIKGEFGTQQEAMENSRDYAKCNILDRNRKVIATIENIGEDSVTVFDESTCKNVAGCDNSNLRDIIKGDAPVPPSLFGGARVSLYATPTDVNLPSINVSSSSEIQNINNMLRSGQYGPVRTTLREYIVGFPIDISASVSSNGYFGNDKGQLCLEAGGQRTCENINPSGSAYVRMSVTPQSAGEFGIKAWHDADDERFSIQINGEAYGNREETSRTITVYRYVCGQGFCWECDKEPPNFTNLKAYCKIVEPAKCKAYIGSDCRAKGRE
jgi:hypothetical protein